MFNKSTTTLFVIIYLPLISFLQNNSTSCEGARILAIIPTPSYSHQIVFRPLWNELARRGHDLVVITTDPQNDPALNIKEININFTYNLWHEYQVPQIFEKYSDSPYSLFWELSDSAWKICDAELSHAEVQAMIQNENEHFDLLIAELTYTAMLAFAERFKCPYIGVTTLDLISSIHQLLGNPAHSSVYPDVLLPFWGPLDFVQRCKSFIVNGMAKVSLKYWTSMEKQVIDKHFGMGMPGIIDMIKKASMVFINEDPAFYIRPLGPAFIPIGGGTHLKAQQPLPEDLQEFMDASDEGIIYFSLGTNVKSNMIDVEMRQIFLKTFSKLPFKVLWKFDVTDMPNVPENVKIMEWLPQQDVLRHPNVKLFIFQGGLQSFEESIFSNVPVVVIPFMADQEFNAQKIIQQGYGIYLHKKQITMENLREAILEVINNHKYKENISRRASLSKDQPWTGLEKAVWWTEYVLRHNGAEHLRNPIIDLPKYQYYFIDIGLGLAFVILSVFALIYACYINVLYFWNRVRLDFDACSRILIYLLITVVQVAFYLCCNLKMYLYRIIRQLSFGTCCNIGNILRSFSVKIHHLRKTD